MGDTKLSLDEDTLGHLDQVRKGKPRRFVALIKSQKVVALRLFKKGRVESQVLLAKKEATGDAYSGVVEGKGLNLSFQIPMTEEVKEAPTANQKLKEYLKETTDESFKAEFVMVERLPSVLDESDPLFRRLMNYRRMMEQVVKAVPSSKQLFDSLDAATLKAIEDEDDQTAQLKFSEIESALEKATTTPDAPEFDQDVSKLVVALTKLKPAILEATELHPQRKTEVLQLVDALGQRIKAKDVKGGGERLQALEKCLEELKAPVPKTEEGEIKRKLSIDLDNLSEEIKEAKLGPKKEKVEALLKEFTNALQIPNYKMAGGILNTLSVYLAQENKAPETTTEWSKKFEFDEKTDELRNYTVGKQLGKGGIGEVKLLQPSNETGGEPLVAKFLLEEHKKNVGLLRRERDIYGRLGDHPSLPKCLGLRKVGGQDALLLEAIDGPTMKDAYEKLKAAVLTNQISETEYWGAVQHMMRRTLQALAYMEEKGFMHGDIKIENVMIDSRTGEVKVIDLGGVTEIGQVLGQGTYNYAPPEAQGRNNNGDNAVKGNYTTTNKYDVFSSGKSLELAGGKSTINTSYKKLLDKMLAGKSDERMTLQEALSHEFFSDSLLDEEQGRSALQRLTSKKTPKSEEEALANIPEIVDQSTWDQAMQTLSKAGMFDLGRAPPLIKRMSEYYRVFGAPENAYTKFPRETQWDKKQPAMENAFQAAESAVATIEELQKLCGDPKRLNDARSWWMKALGEVKEVRKLGPFELTTKKFADQWRKIKSEAKKPFDNLIDETFERWAKLELMAARSKLQEANAPSEELDKFDETDDKIRKAKVKELRSDKKWQAVKSFESFFEFTENFSGALDDFEKAVARKKDVKAKQLAAVTIAKKYYDSVRARANVKFGDVKGSETFAAAGYGLGGKMIFELRTRMNDLIASIVRIKA